MGMYTECLVKAKIVKPAGAVVDAVLNHMFNGADEPDILPDHPFFSKERWSMIGRCSSFYHVPWNSSGYRDGYLFSRSDIKDYDGEIRAFFDWLRPYVHGGPDTCIGWEWYEEDGAPTLIFVRGEDRRA